MSRYVCSIAGYQRLSQCSSRIFNVSMAGLQRIFLNRLQPNIMPPILAYRIEILNYNITAAPFISPPKNSQAPATKKEEKNLRDDPIPVEPLPLREMIHLQDDKRPLPHILAVNRLVDPAFHQS